MTTKEQLLAKHAKELEQFEVESEIRAALEHVPGYDPKDSSICFHGDHHSIRLWKDYQTTMTLHDAVKVVQWFRSNIVTAEHWKNGCISVRPSEINSYVKDERAVRLGDHVVQIEVRGGRGFGPDVKVQFWTRLAANRLCEISLPVCGQWKLVPQVRGKYDQHGHFSGKVQWNPAETQTADSFRKWSSDAPNYHGCYYLADVPNFESWASNH